MVNYSISFPRRDVEDKHFEFKEKVVGHTVLTVLDPFVQAIKLFTADILASWSQNAIRKFEFMWHNSRPLHVHGGFKICTVLISENART